MSLDELLEKRVNILIEYRGYNILEKEAQKDGVRYTLETSKKNRIVLYAIPASNAIGVRYVNQLKKEMDKMDVEEGIMISQGHYTQAAKTLARRDKIELIPLTAPAFNIFQHVLVPVHQILTQEEKEEVLEKYKVKPYQLPRIKASDPVAKAIGSKPGDILRIIRNSPTAGKYISYRYVVEG